MVKSTPKSVTAYIALGSNLGDRYNQIHQALGFLAETPGIRLGSVSRLIETQPIGTPDQPNFVNGVAEIETTLEPLDLLDRLLNIEQALGRRRERRWGPRTMDLDILLYGQEVIQRPRLTVPHPELPNRPFLQAALADLGVSRTIAHG